MSADPRDIAGVMLDGISAFYNKGKLRNIKLIHIVVFQLHMVKDFKTTIKEKAQGPQPGVWARFKGRNLCHNVVAVVLNIVIHTRMCATHAPLLGIKCLFSLLIHISPGKLNGHNGLYPVSLLLSSYL